MIALKDILYKVTINAVVGSTSVQLNAIDFDSRNIKSGMFLLLLKEVLLMGIIILILP